MELGDDRCLACCAESFYFQPEEASNNQLLVEISGKHYFVCSRCAEEWVRRLHNEIFGNIGERS